MSARNEFDRELEILHLDMIRMGGLIEDAIDKSITALNRHDQELAQSIVVGDKKIDDLEKQIETECLRLLLRQQPVAKDLRAISTAMKMITDMERIGDQAADIAELSLRFNEAPFIQTTRNLPLMASIASQMVKSSVDAFVRSDLEASHNIIRQDDEVDSLFEKVKQDIIALLVKTPDDADQALDVMMIAKYLERIGDHAVNIAEWVIFFVTGEHKDKKIL